MWDLEFGLDNSGLTQNQVTDNGGVSHLACAKDWCVLKHVECINAGSELNQQLNTGHVTGVGSRMQGGTTCLVLSVHIKVVL